MGGNERNDNKSAPVQTLTQSPIVQKLWRARDEAKRRIVGAGDGESDVSLAAARVLSDATDKKEDRGQSAADSGKSKHPRESQVSIAYLFSEDQFLLETYRK